MSKILPLDPKFEFDIKFCWERTYPPKFYVSENLLRLKLVNDKTFLPDHSFSLHNSTGTKAFICAKTDPYGTLFGEPNLNRIHISTFAFAQRRHGEELLKHFLNEIPKNRPVVFGQDQGHFFPGVPEECPELLNLLLANGFEKQGEFANDLERDLGEFQVKPDWLTPLGAGDLQVKTCSPSDIHALKEFFAREFPGRWEYDTVVEKCQMWNEYDEIVALWQGDTIEGFAYTQSSETTKVPTAGFVWIHDLGPKSGALGPIGVSKKVRGQKLGGALLVAGLDHLKRLGVRRCIIDWTSLTDFYGKYGFRVNRRYQPVTRPAQSE